MKKLFASVMLVAFAMAAQAGEGKDCSEKAACGAKKVSTEAKAQCPAGAKQVKAVKEAKAVKASATKVKSGCCPLDKQAVTAKVTSPKATEQAKR